MPRRLESPEDARVKAGLNPVASYRGLKNVNDYLKSVPEKWKRVVQAQGALSFYGEPTKETLVDIRDPEEEKELVGFSSTLLDVCTSKDVANSYVSRA